jgi:predicted porin
LYAQGEYDDNIFLTERNEQDDFITTVSPGINLGYLTPKGEIELDYEFRKVFYDDFSDLDYNGHRARGVARMDFTSWFSAGIREIYIRDEDRLELTGDPEFEKPSVRQGRRDRYTRNIVEPETTFRFGENRSIRLGYRNMILRNDRDNEADQDENRGNALLTYRFNIHNGIEIFGEYITKDYDKTIPPRPDRDFDGYTTSGRYIYYFDPKTSAFVEYQYVYRDFDNPSLAFFDYEIHTPSIGFSRDLYENVTLSASAGYAYRDTERPGDDEEAFFGRTDLVIEYKRLRLSVYGETGVDEDFFTAESLGFNKFWRAGINAQYQLLERLRVRGFFYVEEEDFTDINREDTTYNFRGMLDYQILRWLFLDLEYEYNKRDSERALQDYDNNRYLARLTVAYDIAEFLW